MWFSNPTFCNLRNSFWKIRVFIYLKNSSRWLMQISIFNSGLQQNSKTMRQLWPCWILLESVYWLHFRLWFNWKWSQDLSSIQVCFMSFISRMKAMFSHRRFQEDISQIKLFNHIYHFYSIMFFHGAKEVIWAYTELLLWESVLYLKKENRKSKH